MSEWREKNKLRRHELADLRRQLDIADRLSANASAVYDSIQPAVSSPATTLVAWAKASSSWHNETGNGSYVDCYPCADPTGAEADTSRTVRVILPRGPGRDPNVTADQMIGYLAGAGGVNTAVTGHLDDAIGTVKLWRLSGDPPAGWQDYAALRGRFPAGHLAGDADFGTLEGEGGAALHCHAIQRDPASTPCGTTFVDEGTWDTTVLGIAENKALPPYRVVRFIERIDNSL